ncbi:MAG: adenylate/guanylate cyclase domain-containing protein [Myxococcota bacterium]
MNPTAGVAIVAALALCALGAAWWHSRREAARLLRRLRSTSAELENLQLAFSRFAPDPVVERVIADGIDHRGEKVEVTALFADLVGFTALAEQLPPDVLVRVLNGYFERMSAAIGQHKGHVATLIGDGLLALFGALEPNPWQTHDAAAAALAMRHALEAYNRELREQGLPELAIGIGLHRDVGVAGLVGSRDRMEFAIVGRTVNVAARVQDLTREHAASVIATDAVAERLDARFVLRPLPPTPVKGVERPLRIHAVESFHEAGGAPTG